MFNEHDYRNILVLVDFAFENGMIQSQDDAKVLFVLQNKAQAALDAEEKNGDDIPAGD